MNQVISWLQSVRLRRVLTAFLVALTFIVGTTFDHYGNELQAQAEPVTPEAVDYKVDRTDTKKNLQDKDKNLLENIREKLNLDEPIDPGTKQTFEQIQDNASKAVNAPQYSSKDTADKVGSYRD